MLKRKNRGEEEREEKRKGRFSASNKTVQVGNSDYCSNLQASVLVCRFLMQKLSFSTYDIAPYIKVY